MRRARTLLWILALGTVVFYGSRSAWATNTRMVGFGLANAYQPGSCSFCHGQAVAGSPVGQYWPAGASGSYPNRAADHPQHLAAMSLARYQETIDELVTDTAVGTAHDKQVALCLACHPDPGQSRAGTGEASHAVNAEPAGTADVHGDGRTPSTASTFQTIQKEDDPSLSGVAQVVQGTYNSSAAVNGKRCSNVDCHYREPTPVTGASPDGWYNSLAVATCSNCHGSGTAGAMLPDAHQAHVGSKTASGVPAGREYACTQCHPSHGSNTGHQNGAVDLSFTAALGEPGAVPGSQTGSDLRVKFGGPMQVFQPGDPPPGDAYATCSNFYCHGADLGNGGTDQTPTWNDHRTGDCGTCHGINGDPVAIERPAGMAVTSGNHPVHFTSAWGPQLEAPPIMTTKQHSSSGCYQCHNSVDPAAHAAACTDCHGPDFPTTNFGAYRPGASNPTASHVDLKVDFGNTLQTTAAQSVLGATAPAGAPDGTSTDRCNQCHSTTNIPGVGVGTVLVKANWADPGYGLDCLTCHNAADPATQNADGTGVVAPPKDTHYAMRGHGLSSGSNYSWVPNRSGAGAACSDCHDASTAHISDTAGDTDRLVTAGNALCDSCHDGSGTGNKAQTRVSTHGNRSTTMSYTAKRSAFELNCVECHDVHGSANAYMVNTGNADGPLVPVRYYGGSENLTTFLFGGAVSFTANDPGGPDYAAQASGDTSKICQTCHTATSFYTRSTGAGGHPNTDCLLCHKHAYDDDFGPGSQDGFMPAGCNGCHGYPPIRPTEVARLALPGVNNCTDLAASSSDYQCENYVSGGGHHWVHVEALKNRFPASTDARELCGPCHGDGAGSADHNGSNNGPGDWLISARGYVNIRAKASGQSSWGADGTYNADPVTAAGTTPPGSAMTEANSRCAGLDCHGRPTVAENLNWYTPITDGADPSDGLAKSQACKGCHDRTPSQWRAYDAGGSLVYTGNAPDAAANYYGTVSGYSRGGHGDAGIQNEDPFVNSASGTTPVDCTACHLASADHFPASAGNLHRLRNATIEDAAGAGLCNECHPRGTYPGDHHPSLRGVKDNPTRDVVVTAASQPVRRNPTTWFENPPGSDHWEQDGYSAANVSGNSDFFVDWWTGPGSPPRPQPLAVLPLIQFVGNQSGPTNGVICVTCHNPHGTDLYVFDPGGIGGSIPDNNMLRLRDEDNTLCHGCHMNLP